MASRNSKSDQLPASGKLFSQLAKEHAREVGRKARNHAYYHMGTGLKVMDAFNTLNATLCAERENPATAAGAMSHADFQLLKQGITNFKVRINVHNMHQLQYTQIMPSTGKALRNILSPETIQGRFSLEELMKIIATELGAFLKEESRKSDRKAVVEQIKESCRSHRRN
jgi:hypothetical protein